MNEIMDYFLEERKVTKPVAKALMAGFERNPDIADEFRGWIADRTYKEDNWFFSYIEGKACDC